MFLLLSAILAGILAVYKMGIKGIMNAVLNPIAYYGFRLQEHLKRSKMLERWSKASELDRDMVILHCFDPAKTIPNLSGFVMKLATFMRMTKINYKIDTTDPLGPKGKSPWISYNGVNIGDSQLIVEFLSKKLKKDLNAKFSKEQRALATLARVTMEEHVFWGFSLWAFAQDPTESVRKITTLPPGAFGFLNYNVLKIAWGHGIGRHLDEDIQRLLSDDIRAISVIIGNKKYLLGDEPCQEDATVFGLLAQIIWGLGLGSPYEKLVDEELPNIRPYCNRMKERYWQDWDNCLAK